VTLNEAFEGSKPGDRLRHAGILTLDGACINKNDQERIALADGFSSFKEMLAWFKKTHGLPFYGQLIKW
jgi:hypothetical protein